MKMNNLLIILVVWVLGPISLSQAQPDSHILTVKVDGGEASHGQAILSVFSSPDDYLKEPLRSIMNPVDENGQTLFVIKDMRSGEYALSVVYDRDMNGKLNTGLFGLPIEFVGFSNNAKGRFGPPAYDDASFNLLKSEEMIIYLGKAKE